MKILLPVVLSLVLAACATGPDASSKSSSNAEPEKAYRTGSNIPLK